MKKQAISNVICPTKNLQTKVMQVAQTETRGLILREVDYGESSKIFTALSAEMGKLSFIANGVRKNRSGLTSAQLFSYNNYIINQSRGGAYSLSASDRLRSFGGIAQDIENFAYAAYFADVALNLAQEDSPEPQLLSLLLNTFYVLSEGKLTPKQAKPVFELRSMVACGFAPNDEVCEQYGAKGGLLKAMRYIIQADDKKIFAFAMSDEGVDALGRITEVYLADNLGKNLKTLEYLKKFVF